MLSGFAVGVLSTLATLAALALYIYFRRGNTALLSSLMETRSHAEALSMIARRLEITLGSIGDAVMSIDPQGNITQMNPVAEHLTGWSMQEARGRPITEVFVIVNSQTGEPAVNPVDRVLREGSIVGLANHTSLLSRSGASYHIADSAAPIRENDGPIEGVVLAFRDVSEEYEMREALRLSEERHRTLIENSPDIISRFDTSMRYTFVNANITTVTGLAPDDIIGKSHGELGMAPGICDYIQGCLRKALDTGQTFESELDYRGPNGDFILNWRLVPEFDDTGQVKSVLTITRDMTAHRRAEHNYRQVFGALRSGLAIHEIVTDDEGRPVDYRFLDVNPAFEALTGLKASEILGRTVLDVLPGTEPHWIETYGKVALSGEPVEFQNYSQEIGKYFSVVAFSPWPRQFACIFHDVTELMHAGEVITRNLREKEVLLKEIHHRVKNNMQIINSLISLQTAYITDHGSLRLFKETQSRIRSMSLVHERLYQEGDLGHIDLMGYMKSLARNLVYSYSVAPERIEVRVHADADIVLDIDTLIPCGLIVNELLSNSLKYAFKETEGNVITVEIRKTEDGRGISLSVCDNGVGLPEGFSPEASDTLGMQIVSALTGQLDARLSVSSGPGACFRLEFPMPGANAL